MSNYASGHYAEAVAAAYLQDQGFKIIAQNWKTRYCEIDLVAEKDGAVYLVEVKHRASDSQGGGLDYITPKKLAQMRFAAEMWLADNDWTGECCLSALELSGPDYRVTTFIERL